MKFFTKKLDSKELCDSFANAKPFPHVIIDDIFDNEALENLLSCYPKVQDKSWWQYDNPLEKKLAFNDLNQLDPIFSKFFNEANSHSVIKQLSKLSGLDNLIPDKTLRGGGLHQIVSGGKLDVHEDFNINLELKAYRKLNLIVYLNKDWKESYRGELQLWNADMTICEKSVLPIFNRAVIFRTDMNSNHGHPDPLVCPPHVSRKSLATYYYTPLDSFDNTEYRSTLYKKRPQDPDDKEINDFRIKRVKGRLEDKKT
jgi:Rps23 Pro-64 3,4-dihydroxylase Tpa1-like proline 4-hydroxylase